MRLLWILPLLFIGCATEQIGQQSVSPYFEPATNGKTSPYFSINGKPAPPTPATDVPTIRVAAPPSVVMALSQWLGASNTLRVEKAMSIKHGDLSISIPDNASLSYTLSETKGEAVFNTPRPTITAKVFGFSVSPSLTRVELFADNTGTATVSTGPFTTTKKFTLDWKDTETAGVAGTAAIPQKITLEPDDKPRQLEESAPVELPIVYAFSAPNCGPCAAAKKALDEARDLPFRVVWNDPKRQRPYTSSPCFSWNNGNGGVTVSNGWYSLSAFLTMYTASMKPKAASRASSTFPTTAVHYSNPWYEYINNQRANTSVAHLLQHHKLQPHEIEAYRNQPDALNRIHGWLHDNGR
jgi:hypothetical protein